MNISEDVNQYIFYVNQLIIIKLYNCIYTYKF